MSEESKTIISRFYRDLFGSGRLETADEIMADRVLGHPLWANPVDAVTGVPGPAATEDTPQDIKDSVAMWHEMMPDLRATPEEMLVDGDRVIALYTISGTHYSGHAVTIRGIDMFRLSDGKIIEYWQSWDRLGMYQQLGAVPATPQLLPKIRRDLAGRG